MNLAMELDDISYNNIFFNDAIINTIINDSSFIKIIYSNNNLILNSIYIKFDIYKNNNITIIDNIDNLEKIILNMYNPTKTHNYKIIDQLNYLITKLNSSNNKNTFSYILKISGIWETSSLIGLTYKFIYI